MQQYLMPRKVRLRLSRQILSNLTVAPRRVSNVIAISTRIQILLRHIASSENWLSVLREASQSASLRHSRSEYSRRIWNKRNEDLKQTEEDSEES
jgi:hypothetical protein